MPLNTWQAANGAILPSALAATAALNISKPFTVTAEPVTDIWRPNSTSNVFNAPYLYTTLTPNEFSSLNVNVSGTWKTQFDQGGLILALPCTDGAPRRWIKAGIELFEGKPALGVVGTDRFSDWSLTPMVANETSATFEAVRDGREVWIYVRRGGSRLALREVTWAFLDLDDEAMREGELVVGVYAAKPTKDSEDEGGQIEVTFSDLNIERTGCYKITTVFVVNDVSKAGDKDAPNGGNQAYLLHEKKCNIVHKLFENDFEVKVESVRFEDNDKKKRWKWDRYCAGVLSNRGPDGLIAT